MVLAQWGSGIRSERSLDIGKLSICMWVPMYVCITSVPLSANLSMGMSAMIRAQSLNLLEGFEWGKQFHAYENKMI